MTFLLLQTKIFENQSQHHHCTKDDQGIRAQGSMTLLMLRSSGFHGSPYENEWNKWKSHFFEMKGDVGMSSHEKEREQEDAFTQTQTHS